MTSLKCEYCKTDHLKVTDGALICSRCGAPLKNLTVLETALIYVLKSGMMLPAEARERLAESWRQMFDGHAPKLLILDRGFDIQALPTQPTPSADIVDSQE